VSVGVGEGWFLVWRGARGRWVCPVYSGVGCAFVYYDVMAMGVGYVGVGCRVEVVCGWGRDPRFTLEYVELLGAWLIPGVVWFSSSTSWTGC
jgi:hypothetical protein